MEKVYLTKLSTLVNTQKQWEAFNELLEDRVGQYQKVLEQSVNTTELYQAQGAIQALRKLKLLRDEVNAKKP
jgi:hypothetical protein